MSTDSNPHDYEPDVAAAGNRWVAVWSREDPNSPIGWAYSSDGGATWTNGVGRLPQDNSKEGVVFYPSICSDNAGNFYLSVVINALVNNAVGSSIGVWKGNFQGAVFSWQSPTWAFQPTRENWDAPQNACDPLTGEVYVTTTRGLKVLFSRSMNAGQTWSEQELTSSNTSSGSRPIVGPDGEVYVGWLDYATSDVKLRKSTDHGVTFGPANTVSHVNDNLACGSPGYFPHLSRATPVGACGRALSSNFPCLDIDRSNGPFRGSLYATWMDYATGAIPDASGLQYDNEPNDNFANAQTITIGNDVLGTVYRADLHLDTVDTFVFSGVEGSTIWIQGAMLETFPPPAPGTPVRCQTFQLLCSADTVNITKLAQVEIRETALGPMPPMIFTLPRTATYYLVMFPSITFNYDYVLHTRLLSPDPSQAAKDHRDIVLSYSRDGNNWSSPVRVNDDPPRFDNSLPSVAVDAMGHVHVAWYDRRDDPVCGGNVHTYWSQSLDGGTSFQPSHRVSAFSSSWQFGSSQIRSSNIGDHLALLAHDERMSVFWTQQGQPNVDIYSAAISPEPVAVAQSLELSSLGSAVTLLCNPGDHAITAQLYRRGPDDAAFSPTGDPQSVTSSNEPLIFVDATISSGSRYSYYADLVLRSGDRTHTNVLEVQVPSVDAMWFNARPNPFKDRLTVELRSSLITDITLDVYDISGRFIISLPTSPLGSGFREAHWDGRDHTGALVAKGIYLLRASDHNLPAYKVTRQE